MSPLVRRAVIAALFGALSGAACLLTAFAIHPDVMFEMDRDLPRIVFGVYPPERSGDDTFAWTSPRTRVLLAGLDRRRPWGCSVRVRGGRPSGAVQPVVQLAIDGVTLASKAATNEYQEFEILAPARPGSSGLTLTIVTSPTFVPGPSDSRELGVQIDRLACRPAGAGLAWPPRDAMIHAAIAAAAFGAALALGGIASAGVIVATLLLSAAQAWPLSAGAGPYTRYGIDAVWIALWIATFTLVIVRVLEWWTRKPLEKTAQFVMAFSAGALYLKLLALLHPSKLIEDAVFHAHRFEWVLAGRYYFTQPVQNTEFPYAIGLYVFAAPWSVFTSDHVTLLRVVVCAAEVIAGALLYLMIVRTWGDKLTGVVAAFLFNLVPLSYVVVGNANLTNAFGQSAALVTIVAATVCPLRRSDGVQLLGLSLLASLALLSHVSTFALLLTMLAGLAFLYGWKGGPALRAPARSIALALAIAITFSVVSYYGHFLPVYKTLSQVRAQSTATVSPDEPQRVRAGQEAATAPAGRDEMPTPLAIRAARGLAQGASDVGWPILALAIVGLWRVWTLGRDRLTLALAAWGLTYVLFFVFGTAVPVGMRFERYAIEFISRLDYATYPAVVILAARGSIWAWRAGTVPRIASATLLLSALVVGGHQWLRWLE